MTANHSPDPVLKTAEAIVEQGVPIAPYWEGRAFDASLSISLRKPYSREAWDDIFAQLTALLTYQEDQDRRGESTRSAAIRRLQKALQAEQRQATRDQNFVARSPAARLEPILATITAAAGVIPYLFEDFCFEFARFADEAPYNSLFLDWFEQLTAAQVVETDKLLAAKLLFNGFGKDWVTVGDRLINTLDHANLKVRAIAALHLGKFCYRAAYAATPIDHWDYDQADCDRARVETAGMPPIQELFALIRQHEMVRPGVAGAFWGAAPRNTVDEREWLLSILVDAPSPEPYIRGFAVNLAFEAHERFSEDPEAIRRLMDAGRIDVAVAAATDNDYKLPKLQPLLMELGQSRDPFYVKCAVWHLAYYYHCLHPRGVELGFVKQIVPHAELDIYLLFSRPETPEPPYAVTLYPRHRQPVPRTEAQSWVDQIFPAAVRGELRPDMMPWNAAIAWYQRGFVEFYGSDRSSQRPAMDAKTDAAIVEHVIIGYRADDPWNPEVYL